MTDTHNAKSLHRTAGMLKWFCNVASNQVTEWLKRVIPMALPYYYTVEVRNMNGLLGTFPQLLCQTRLSVYFQGVKERINVKEQRNHQLTKPTRHDNAYRILLDLILIR